MPQRIGIFAGTFDPVHHGHIAFAKAAIKLCHLDKVVFLAEPNPRGKVGVTSVAQRVAMLQLAVRHDPALEVLRLPDHQFTVAKTLPKLRQRYNNAQLVMLFGSDVAATLHLWADADTLLAQTELAVGFREGVAPLLSVRATIIPTAHAHVAASHIRQGASNEVPAGVWQYIKEHGLYQV
ncbi:MAG TPA: nicotinate-nicotinamide nucleotide adenylyltransferase [Candidatus Saccharimonadales bacterium]|nr:nicotinate-nicotinamide nucleotide adenylyltransferase [Candidatus Saccharimonadales bacterium]